MRLFRVRHYRRTCRACGHVWEIARALANERIPGRRIAGELAGPRPPLLRPFAGRSARSSRTSRGHEDDVVARRRAVVARLERIDRNSRCPECGGKDYDQRVV